MNNIEYWLALHRTPKIGPKKISALISHFGSVKDIFSPASFKELAFMGLSDNTIKHIESPNWEKVSSDLKWMELPQNHIITCACPEFPPQLHEISAVPPVLYICGNLEILLSPQIAMVGSRSPTLTGINTARDFAESLSTSGITITSGLALGIDAASHDGALQGIGSTIAVTATGLDRIYPAKHRDLAYKIIETGAIISEFPIGTPPKAENFPRRNRIISGLAIGTVVVEAALKSGSLITASYAYEQNKEVFAIPGSINNPLSKGCHMLIKQGAKLVETANDIIEEIAPMIETQQTLLTPETLTDTIDPPRIELNLDLDLDEEYGTLLNQIDHSPVSVDILIERTGFSANTICSMLLILEMKGVITSITGGIYCRTQ